MDSKPYDNKKLDDEKSRQTKGQEALDVNDVKECHKCRSTMCKCALPQSRTRWALYEDSES